jgi:AcrR family transcriptional regulator
MIPTETRRPPALQGRSRETRQRILEAALHILRESGVEALSTAHVSEVAGVSVGSIYRRFGNKEQLLLATQAEFVRAFLEDFTARLDELPSGGVEVSPPVAFAHAAESLVREFEANAQAMRVLLLLGLQNAEIFEAGRQAGAAGGRAYARFMLEHRAAIRRPDPEQAVDYTFRLIYAACSHRITQGPDLDSPRRLSWDELVHELSETVCAYLLTPPWLPTAS